jgi:GT2 family glycosyltransferase
LASQDSSVSIIVPSYNSRATIVRCLESIRALEGPEPLEVILVDSSEDGTDTLVAERFPEVTLVHLEERALPGQARNVGIARARGELLAFTDADCVVDPGWLIALRERHAREDCAAVGGSVTNGLPGNPVAWVGCLVEFNEFLPSAPARDTELLPTCNVCYRREVFERHGPFPEDLWPSEDHVFAHNVAAAGERLVFEPSIIVQHLFRPSWRAYLAHQRRLGAASAGARRRVALPNAWLVESPLRWLTPLFRLVKIEGRLARRDLANFLRFNALLPLSLGGLIAWGVGFSTGSAEGGRS